MKKRVLALLLVLVMAMSLVACGSKDKKVSTKEENGTTTTVADSNESKDPTSSADPTDPTSGNSGSTGNDAGSTNNKMAKILEKLNTVEATGVEIKATIDGMSFSMTANTNGENAKIDVVFAGTKVTDIVFTNNVLYVNCKDLAAFLDAMSGENQYAQVVDMLVGKDYISCTEAELQNIMQMVTEGMESSGASTDAEMEEMVTSLVSFAQAMTVFAVEAYASVAEELEAKTVTYTDSTVEFVLNNANIKDVLTILKKADVKEPLKNLYAAIKDNKLFEGEFTETPDFDASVKEYQDSIQEAIDNLDLSEENEVKVVFGVKNKALVASVSVKGGDQSASFEVTTINNKATIAAPASVNSITEVIKNYQELAASQN